MYRVRFFLYCCLFVVLSAFCVTGYWFYKTQSLKNNIVSILNSFSLFEYSDYRLEGFFEYKSRVSFTKPVLKVDNLNKPLLVQFDELIFTSIPSKKAIKISNPSTAAVISAADGRFHCKNLDEAYMASMPGEKNGLTLSIKKEKLECHIQTTKTKGETTIFDIAFNMGYSQKNALESTINLVLSLGEGTKKIETDMMLVNLSGRPPTYTLDVKRLDIFTHEHTCNIMGRIELSPGYASVAKGRMCLTVQGAHHLFSSIEKSLDSGVTARKAHGFLRKMGHFIDRDHDTLHVCVQEKNGELVIGTERNVIPLLKMF